MPYGNVKAGIAATSSVVGTAIAYNQYGTGSGNHPQTKNAGNFQKYSQTSSQTNYFNQKISSNTSGKLHEDAAKQMQMWKF